jgi:hypothetical protein
MTAVRAETKAKLFKQRHKPSDFIKDREFRDKTSDQRLLEDSPVPRKLYDIRRDTEVSRSITIPSVTLHITLDGFFSLNLKLRYISAK